jgi:hypothetical protein
MATGARKYSTVARPYVITFHATGTRYLLTSEEAQRLLDEYPIVRAYQNRIILQGHNTPDPKQRVTLEPATVGGGVAFTWTRD